MNVGWRAGSAKCINSHESVSANKLVPCGTTRRNWWSTSIGNSLWSSWRIQE